MSWHKIKMTSAQIANADHIKIQDEFKKIFTSSNAPKEMALFSSKVPKSPQEFVVLYFSPGCSPLADSLISQNSGTPSEIPKEMEVALMVGQDDAWDLLD